MAYQSHALSIEDALATSQATYDVDFEKWGFRQLPDLEENIRFPSTGQRAIPTTLAGLSIGPRSTVDRCWVSWDRQKNLTVIDDVTGDITSQLRLLSVESPLSYAQATNAGALAPNVPPVHDATTEAMQSGLLYVFAYDEGAFATGAGYTGVEGKTTILPASYIDQFGVVRAVPAGGTDQFEAPFLHLVLNLRAGFYAPPVKRFPMLRSNRDVASSAQPKKRLFMLPIFGRKHVRVQVISHNITGVNPAGANDIWVGLIRNVNESLALTPSAFSPVFEVNAGTALGLAANTPFQFVIDNPCADYLTLYATGPVGGNFLCFTVVAED